MIVDIFKIEEDIKNKKYRYIGQGSSRKVFDMRNGYVVKIARNNAGIAQNNAEYKIYNRDDSKIFAKVLGVSEDYRYLIMEKAKAIRDYNIILEYFDVNYKGDLKSVVIIVKIMNKHSLLWGDIKKKSSWGIIGDRLVMIDYGFTYNIKKQYYQ